MKKPSDEWADLRQRVLGFGGASAHKSYYPALRRKLQELQRAQTDLHGSRQLLQLAVEGAELGTWEYNGDTHAIDANAFACRALGYDPETMPRRLAALADLVHPDDRATVQAALAQAGTDQPTTNAEVRLRHVAGHWVTAWVRGRVLESGPDGRPLRAAGTMEDVSEQRRAEAEQRKLEAQIQHGQKLESLGVLAGGIAHDFNNLLAAILGYAELCGDDLPETSPCREFVEQIHAAATSAAELTNQMLAYSGRGQFIVEPLRLDDLVHQMGRLLSVSLSKGIRLEFEHEPDLPLVEADVAQIRQVVMNLVTNAGDAMAGETGVIRLRTSTTTLEAPRWEPVQAEPGRYVCVEVEDQGCGMDPETQQHVFDPFFTTKRTGRGLGMAAVLGIVRGHHGAIDIDSELGRGTRFRVLFPVYRGATAAPEPTPLPVLEPTVGRMVLVVDDEPAVRKLCERMLRTEGWTVVLAASGDEALLAFDRHREQLDAVLLDMTMPGMDGVEVFERLRAADPEVRVVLMSGYSEQDSLTRLSDRPQAFLHKPFRVRDMRVAMKAALQGLELSGTKDLEIAR